MHPWAAQVSTSDYMQGWFADILCLTSSTLCRGADNLKSLLHLFEPLSRSQNQMEDGEYRLRGEYDHTSNIRPQEAYFWDKFWSNPLSSLSKLQVANETHDTSTRRIRINVDQILRAFSLPRSISLFAQSVELRKQSAALLVRQTKVKLCKHRHLHQF